MDDERGNDLSADARDSIGDAPSPNSESNSMRDDVSASSDSEIEPEALPSAAEQLEAIGFGSFHKWCIFASCSVLSSVSAELAIHNMLADGISDEWEVFKSKRGIISCGFIFSFVLGCVVGGVFADRQGRHPIILLSSLLYLISTFLSAIAPDAVVLMLARFLASLFLGSQLPVVIVLFSELMPKGWRSVCGTVVLGAALFSGTMLMELGLVNFRWCEISNKDLWRCLHALILIPQSFGLSIYWSNIPESPRWLITQGRVKMCSALIIHISEQSSGTSFLQGDGSVRRSGVFHYDQMIGGVLRSYQVLQACLCFFLCILLAALSSLMTNERILSAYTVQTNSKTLISSSLLPFFWLQSMQPAAIAICVATNHLFGHRLMVIGSFLLAAGCAGFLVLAWSPYFVMIFGLLKLCSLSIAIDLTIIGMVESLPTVCRCSGFGVTALFSILSVTLIWNVLTSSVSLAGPDWLWKEAVQGLFCIAGSIAAYTSLKETRWSEMQDYPADTLS